ncbi:MAG: D-alanyl-D-alanine carboxypeptidase/D-alanyl-D-alanine-endopeptidase [Gammaproteobacteria bacterium]|nr:D-alanyl-D-alanine carboxypeptidase/D-alanyl-D-alanine-endopeptidase [Gammaproteobacteria bacterium]
MKNTILLSCVLLTSVLSAADADLPPGVQNALTVRQVPAESLSLYVSDLETGEVLLDIRGDEPRNPASTIKLLTTLVALDVLGPAYRWHTDVFANGELQDGRLDGDLLIKGYGDPFLVTERVWQLLRNLRHAGVRDINGDLLLDDSWFDVGGYDPGAFDKQPLRAYNVAPNALLMNFKVVRYWFEPDHESQSVDVRVDPPLNNLLVKNRLGLKAGSCRGFQRGIAVSMNERVDEVTFSGRFPNGCKRYAMDRTALSHNEFVYGLFQSLWSDSGGSLSGGWKSAVAPEDAEPLLSFRSLPLSEMIARVNKHSNNVMARQLLYTLGAEVNGAPGTEESGKAVVSEWLTDNNLESCKTAIQNGAGLSRASRMTARDMAKLLTFAWRQPYMPEYLASMSLSGLDGTLRRRFENTDLIGKAHLKTGSLDHVTAIAGYLQSRSGRRFAVVALQNYEDIHRGPGEEAQEALLRWLYEQ